MAFKFANPNPCNKLVGDCSIRACSIAVDKSWSVAHADICALSSIRCNMPSANSVWGEYLIKNGFAIDDIYRPILRRYTVRQFCRDHPRGLYVLGIGDHVVTVIDGDWYDIWDSGDEIVQYYFRRE